jgi:ribonuclease HI
MENETLLEVKMFTDGAARGNPNGPGGYGVIIQYTDENGELHERELSDGTQATTNNKMELLAVIIGLETLTRPCKVHVVSDSTYVVNPFNKGWIYSWQKKGWKNASNDPVKNVDLWKRLLNAMKPHQVTFEWIRGHCGYPENERCDKLATQAADKFKIRRG